LFEWNGSHVLSAELVESVQGRHRFSSHEWMHWCNTSSTAFSTVNAITGTAISAEGPALQCLQKTTGFGSYTADVIKVCLEEREKMRRGVGVGIQHHCILSYHRVCHTLLFNK